MNLFFLLSTTLVGIAIFSRSLGLNAAISESIALFSIIITFLRPNIKTLVVSLSFLALYFFYYIFIGIEFLIYLIWTVTVIVIANSPELKLERYDITILKFLFMILFFYIYYKMLTGGIDLSYRDALIFEGPLALGFFCSSSVIFVYCVMNNLYNRILSYLMIFPVVIISGGRHPALIFVLVLILEFFEAFTYRGKVAKIFTFILAIIIIGIFLVYSTSDEIVLRSFSYVEKSDIGRLNSWSELFILETPHDLLFGMGRENVGSIGVRAKGEAYVIESSYGTIILSHGLVGLLFVIPGLIYFFYKAIKNSKSNNALAVCIIIILEPFISQRFETPTIMWFYFVIFSVLPYLDQRFPLKFYER